MKWERRKIRIVKFQTWTTECWYRFLIWGAVRRSREELVLGVQLWACYCDPLADISGQSCWIYLDRWVCVSGESSAIEGDICVIWAYMVLKDGWLDEVLEGRDWLYTEKINFVKNEPWILQHRRDWKEEAEPVNMIEKVQPVKQEENQVLCERSVFSWLQCCWAAAHKDWYSPLESGNVRAMGSLGLWGEVGQTAPWSPYKRGPMQWTQAAASCKNSYKWDKRNGMELGVQYILNVLLATWILMVAFDVLWNTMFWFLTCFSLR